MSCQAGHREAVRFVPRHDDSSFVAGRLKDRLVGLGKENVFYDVDSLGAGVDFRVVIAERLKEADAILAVIDKLAASAAALARRLRANRTQAGPPARQGFDPDPDPAGTDAGNGSTARGIEEPSLSARPPAAP